MKWKRKHPEFAAALLAGRDSAGEVAVSLLRRAKGYRRKTVKPMVVGIGNGLTKIVDWPMVEYFPPDVKACLEWLKRHRPDVWGDLGEDSNTIRQWTIGFVKFDPASPVSATAIAKA